MSRKYLLLLVFPLGYAASYLATGYYAVYHLDWWDLKFGSPAGNLAFGRELLPYFAAVASVSHVTGLAVSWRRLRTASAWRIAVVELAAGVLSDFIPFGYNVATRDLSPQHPWAGADQAVALGLLFIGPALIAWTAWRVGSNSGRSEPAVAA
jgi:hypothetical protein